jgi:signal recognition particle receptor subunit beta
MAVFSYFRKEIDVKIVYYGPGLSGKTTNLQFIHQNIEPSQRGKMVSLATNEDRTLFFDFLPIELENIRRYKMRFHLYTVPGQVYYKATRLAVLTGVDGLILVVDSQTEKMEENLYSLKELKENLQKYGKRIETIPLIIQYNKRDLPDILPIEELNKEINYLNFPYFASVATEGKGVFESLTMVSHMVWEAIKEARRSAAMAYTPLEETEADPPRIEGTISRPGSPRESQGRTRPRPIFLLKKGLSGPEPSRANPDTAPARILRPGKEAPRTETSRPVRIPWLGGAKPKEETSTKVGRPIISRSSGPKKLKPSAEDEEPEEKI